jgi:hypothetical protein
MAGLMKSNPMTPTEAMEKAIREIRAYKGAAVERAVYGAIGAATAFERIGSFSLDEGADWCQAARDAGEAQQKRLARRSFEK